MKLKVDARIRLLAAALLFLATGTSQAVGDPEEGRLKAMQCAACHGIEGRDANPSFPRLAGQSATYLAVQLQEFRSGERYHPVMSPIAEALTDEDIDDLAEYFSQVPLTEEP